MSYFCTLQFDGFEKRAGRRTRGGREEREGCWLSHLGAFAPKLYYSLFLMPMELPHHVASTDSTVQGCLVLLLLHTRKTLSLSPVDNTAQDAQRQEPKPPSTGAYNSHLMLC